MRKLLLFLALLPLFASAQIPAANDTTLITPNTPFTPQYRFSNVTLGGVNYRIPQVYNSLLGKYDTYVTTKYLRAFYAPLVGGGYVPTSRTLTINGVTQDLSANRTWTINTTPTQASLTGNNRIALWNSNDSLTVLPQSYFNYNLSGNYFQSFAEWNFLGTTNMGNTHFLLAPTVGDNPIRLQDSTKYTKYGIGTVIYADAYKDSLATSIFNNGLGVNTGSAIVKALQALNTLGGGTLVLSTKRYLPTGYTGDGVGNYMPYDNIRIIGAGSGDYSDSLRTITGGSIIQGAFYHWNNNFVMENLSVDAGKTVTDTYYNGISYSTLASGDYAGDYGFKSNHTYKNIKTLAVLNAGGSHSFLTENVNGVNIDNVQGAGGFAAIVIKSSNVNSRGLVAYATTTYPMVIKADNTHGFVAKNINVEDFIYQRTPYLITPYTYVAPPAQAINIDSYATEIGPVNIEGAVIKDTVGIGVNITSRLGAGVTKGVHVGNLVMSTNSASVLTDGHAVDNYTFDNITINGQFPYVFIKQDSLNNQNGNIGTINANNITPTGNAGILLNVNGASSGSHLNINNYNLKNQTYAYFVPDTANNKIQVQNENFWSGLTNRNVASPVYYTDKILLKAIRANTVTVNGNTQNIIDNPTFTVASLPPSGAAGGDLGGTYPNPTITFNSGLKSFSDGSYGLQIGYNSSVAGYGTIFPFGVTPSGTNWTFATNVLDCFINASANTGLQVGGVLKFFATSTQAKSIVPITFAGYTVATLPAGVQGMNAYVTDALAPTYLVTVVGGGAIVTPVFYNGTNWVCH